MSVLIEHMAALRKRFIAEHGKAPAVLAIGRWDARELARAWADMSGGVTSAPSPRALLRDARNGITLSFPDGDVEVKLDGRLARCPGALWWHA
jgi:hypothetical protein